MSIRTATLIVGALSFCSNVHANELNPKFEKLLEGEAKYIQRIRDAFLIVQARQKAEGGKVLRGTHAKGVCTKARFQVLARPERCLAVIAIQRTPSHNPRACQQQCSSAGTRGRSS